MIDFNFVGSLPGFNPADNLTGFNPASILFGFNPAGILIIFNSAGKTDQNKSLKSKILFQILPLVAIFKIYKPTLVSNA